MEITLTLKGEDLKQHAKTLRAFADQFDSNTPKIKTVSKNRMDIDEDEDVKEDEEETGEQEIDNNDVNHYESDEEADIEPEASDEEITDEEEKPAAKKAKAPAKGSKSAKGNSDLEDRIIPAFQKYAKKHTNAAAFKVLKKYGIKSVRDLPSTKFNEVLKLLKA